MTDANAGEAMAEYDNPYPPGSPLWSARNTIDQLVRRSKEDEERIRALEAELAAARERLIELNALENHATARAERAEARLADAERLLRVVMGLPQGSAPVHDAFLAIQRFLSSDRAGRGSGKPTSPPDTERISGTSLEAGASPRPAAANPGVVEVIGADGTVHYRRPEGDPLLDEAARTPGVTLRRKRRGSAESDHAECEE